MKKFVVNLLCVFAISSAKADIVVVLNDNEKAALIANLAVALQSNPQLVAPITYLLNKINTAPVMTDQKEVKPDVSKDEKQ